MWRESPGMKFTTNAHVQRLPSHSPATSTWKYPNLRANMLMVKQRNSEKLSRSNQLVYFVWQYVSLFMCVVVLINLCVNKGFEEAGLSHWVTC